MEPGYLAALTTGLIGGFGHCIGMCGPIVSSFTLHDIRQPATPLNPPLVRGDLRGVLPHLLYNTGRITTYVFIGALMGLTGSFVNTAGRLAGFQEIAAIAAGLFMVLMGLHISGFIGKAAWLESRSGVIFKAGAYILMEKSLWRYYPLGALFGFIPCGLSYSIFITAAGTGSLLSGMLVSLLFGLGTMPALLLVGAATSYMGVKLRGFLYKVAGGVVIVTGILFIMRGIKLYAGM